MFVHQYENQYLIVVDRGVPLVETLTQVVIDHKIQGGSISGIGALMDVELGYYDPHKKDYKRKTFSEEDYELIALNGNISLRDGAPYVHVHAALGNSDFGVFGGHLFEAKVAVTAEVYITPFGVMPERSYQEALGLQTIVRCSL